MQPDELIGFSDRDILIDVRGMVKQLADSRDDHETRIRANEKEVAEMKTSKREQSEQMRRILGWGMFLAAIAGAFGDLFMKAIQAKP